MGILISLDTRCGTMDDDGGVEDNGPAMERGVVASGVFLGRLCFPSPLAMNKSIRGNAVVVDDDDFDEVEGNEGTLVVVGNPVAILSAPHMATDKAIMMNQCTR